MAKAKITRIKASDSRDNEPAEPTITRKKVVLKDKKQEKKDKKQEKKAAKAAKTQTGKKHFILFRPFCALGRYFKESWQEIRQVRWPNRKETWKLVISVIVYVILIAGFIMLLDVLFNFIFSQIYGGNN